jgi:hypothetical protein
MPAEFGLTWGGHSSQLIEVLDHQEMLTMVLDQGSVSLALK